MASDQYLYDQLGALDERIEQLEQRIDGLESENERLRERVGDIDARTDMLQLVEEVDGMTAEQRSISILQHMHRRLQRRDTDRVALTREQVEECLHYPGLDRSTFYTDMRRCERLVGDEELCYYAGDGVGSRDEAAVVLDLERGELPAQYRGGREQ